MAVLVADIIQGVQDQYATVVADAKMRRLIAKAVRYYSRWNPYVQSTSFSTVLDQQAYDLPADCVGVLDVLWLPMGDVLISGSEALTITQAELLDTYNQYALRYVSDINEMEYHDAIKGNWEIRNAQVFLWPIPTSASHTVTVQYYIVHVLTSTTSYATIPAEDLDILVDLTLAELLQSGRLDASLRPSWAEGLTRVSYRGISSDVQTAVEDLRRGVQGRYNRAAGEVA